MSGELSNQELLAQSRVSEEIYALRPDYVALLIVADDLVPGPSNEFSEQLLNKAELTIQNLLGEDGSVDDLPAISIWRDAYRAFGAKPQRTRPSAEALIRRASSGLPRIDRITDIYNAMSVTHMIPIGGENADRYVGPATLIRSAGSEPFETTTDGSENIENPEIGEVVWTDEAGVTCRRWNWRQSLRTRISQDTTRALFILDGLTEIISQEELVEVGLELQEALASFSPDATFSSRVITR